MGKHRGVEIHAVGAVQAGEALAEAEGKSGLGHGGDVVG